jgi:hypothetical protein
MIREKLKTETKASYAKMTPKERIALAIEISYLAREFRTGILKSQKNQNESYKKRLPKAQRVPQKTAKRKPH